MSERNEIERKPIPSKHLPSSSQHSPPPIETTLFYLLPYPSQFATDDNPLSGQNYNSPAGDNPTQLDAAIPSPLQGEAPPAINFKKGAPNLANLIFRVGDPLLGQNGNSPVGAIPAELGLPQPPVKAKPTQVKMEPVNDLEMRVRTVERIQSLAALDRLEFEKKVIEYKKQSENNAIIRIIKTEEEEEDVMDYQMLFDLNNKLKNHVLETD
ncbi:hypothetical protein PHJA_001281000 [Phtheirospermum japonicum]|uniref:Uncharacterized protein n=1 Tax=Phtheirospermum japonicum TaxID=374723 RepID=A0A830BV77_9LAMI|nr:hypothetical protein PHJA_001281000 [Phtheirospermum japonicum]